MTLKIKPFKSGLICLTLLSAVLIPGCLESKNPQVVSKSFWDAIKAQESDTAYKYSTIDSQNSIDLLDGQLHVTEVTFGKILIDGNKTTIETTIQIRKNDSEETIPLQTILITEAGLWKVDYVQTKSTFPIHNTFSEMLDNIRDFGDECSENMKNALEDLKQKMPEIEKNMNELSSATSEKIREAWEKHMPEIKKKVEEFGKALEEALKKMGNGSQKENPESDHHDENSITF